MPKRIAIGLLVALPLAIVAIVLLQPKKGPVEYHLREYRTALDRWHRNEPFVKRWFNYFRRRITGGPVININLDLFGVKEAEVMPHENALIKLGYFEERKLLVFNHRAETVMMSAIHSWSRAHSNTTIRPMLNAVFVASGEHASDLAKLRSVGAREADQLAQSVIIVARPEHMPKWADFVQRADAPNKRNWEDVMTRTGLLRRVP